MIPVRQAWYDDAFEVREYRVERLALLGGSIRKRCANITGLDAGQNGVAVRMFEVVGDPVRCAVGVDLRL